MIFSAAFLLFGRTVFRLFVQDAAVLEIAVQMMFYMAPWYWLFVPIEIISGSLRGVGNTLIPTLITAVGICVLRVIWMFAVVPRWHVIQAITISYPLSWALTSAAFIAYYMRIRRKILYL